MPLNGPVPSVGAHVAVNDLGNQGGLSKRYREISVELPGHTWYALHFLLSVTG